MKREINPSETSRAQAFNYWMKYSGIYCNPFLSWGKYRKHWFRVTLPISFQFHHVQMDGGHAAKFLERLQQALNVKFY